MRVEEILRKRDRGEKLTPREETILAYAHYAAREQRMVFAVPRSAESGQTPEKQNDSEGV